MLTASGWETRIRLHGKVRKTLRLTGFRAQDEAGAQARSKLIAELAQRFRAAGVVTTPDALRLLEMAATAQGKALAGVLTVADELIGGEIRPTTGAATLTFSDVMKAWTSGELHDRFPDVVPAKKTADDDECRAKFILERVGSIPITHFRLEHAERVMRELPSTFTSSTRRHYAQLMRRALGLAVYPLRAIEANPIPRGFMPKVKREKALTYLYPDEDARLMASSAPLAWRLLFGFLAREGLRLGEAASLTLADVDLVRGAVKLDENKTDDPRAWALDAGVVRALKVWVERHRDGAEPGERLFTDEYGRPLQTDHMAGAFRDWLRAAGVERPELYEASKVRQPIRVHDLRATFITLALANGRTESWISDRTGHRSSIMINRYKRAARTVAELGLGTLAPLDEALGLSAGVIARPLPGKRRRPLGGMADAADLKSADLTVVPVRPREGLLRPGVRSLAQRVRDARHASQPARLRESWEHPRALERLSLARSSLRLGEFPSG